MSGSKDRRVGHDAAAEGASGPVPESIGGYLSAQRRLRGISIEELSQQTRIPLRSLQRLESGSFDADVDGFVRGFVRTVAEALGLDADDTLTRTLREPGGSARGATSQLSLSRVAAVLLGLGLLLALGFAFQLLVSSLLAEGGASARRSPIVMRRDPVRSLAEAQGVAALSPAPALALASEPPRARPDRKQPRVDPDPGEKPLLQGAAPPPTGP